MAPVGAGQRRRLRGERGDLEDAPVPLHPRGAGELLDAATELLRGRFLVYLGLAALILAPVRLASYYVQDVLLRASEAEVLELVLFGLVVLALPLLVQAAVSAVVIVLVHGQLIGVGIPAGRALALLLRRLPALVLLLMLLSVLLAAVLVIVALPAFFCPPLLLGLLFAALYSSFRLYLATPALMLEHLGPVAAVRRSLELTRAGFPRWVVVYILSMILAAFFTGIASLGDDPDVRREILELVGVDRGPFDAVYLPLSILLNAIGLAFTAVVATAFYLDARMRQEAFDLHMRLERMRAARA